jgi:hypothetical protein
VRHPELLPEQVDLAGTDIRARYEFEQVVLPDGVQLMCCDAGTSNNTEFDHLFYSFRQ